MFDLSIVRGGQPLRASVRASDGREWLVPVVSQGGAPAIPILLGGDGQDPAPPPATALDAIYTELRRLYDSDPEVWPERRLAFQAVGFVDGVRRPHKPGRQADAPEKVAVRTRRLLDDPHGVAGASNTERDVLKRARREGIYSRGKLTVRGEALLEVVDRAKVEIRAALAGEPAITRDELRARLGSTSSESATTAALLDLEVSMEIKPSFVKCAACGTDQLGLARGPHWRDPKSPTSS